MTVSTIPNQSARLRSNYDDLARLVIKAFKPSHEEILDLAEDHAERDDFDAATALWQLLDYASSEQFPGSIAARPVIELTDDAKETLREWGFNPLRWAAIRAGDACGCIDDRCIGYHHAVDQRCGCLEVLLEQEPEL